ncbi:type V toxin-antitoxin system endoribonuclease antitoxin GhoS, partial [Escherichia coli]
MASGDLVRYVITVMLHEDTLTEAFHKKRESISQKARKK